MTFKELYPKRRQSQQKRIFRYFKYIFNDHFILALAFILAALAFQYSQWLKTLTTFNPLYQWTWLVIATALVMGIGKIASFIEKADTVFLLARERDFKAYFSQALAYSLLLPTGIYALFMGVSYPFLLIHQGLSGGQVLAIFVVMVGLKALQLRSVLENFHFYSPSKSRLLMVLTAAYSFCQLYFAVRGKIFLALAFVFVMIVIYYLTSENWQGEKQWDWLKIVGEESQRQERVNQVLSLFVDVPTGQKAVKRRKYLDPLLMTSKNNPYYFLYQRAFCRSQDYFNLWLRLTALATLLVYFLPSHPLTYCLGLLLLYASHFQILPLYRRYYKHPLMKIYPLDQGQALPAFRRFLYLPLGLQTAFQTMSFLMSKSWQDSVIFLILAGLMTILFTRVYLPRRLRGKNRLLEKLHR
ncbi:ABC transporter permease [Aerococcus urinae]|uniref:ABC transporter permease n=1 Tax=Aerococcus mictus TaxID=2976810 RepID=A0A1E9PBY1_9LACT|nr:MULTISPECIES: ABC transporter permease [Aerococcus]KAA9291828.1 ABC transporter permease [Aerococcus mictus]MBU5610082.1 ABC transporter permease [Aerococcus urinae]MCY3034757.1 ABC transporter permease [Aerococcus mictus]MCY3064091.1 ABC transporter permease [Aerococcus mictus]MCY3064886.1 ABC transporter permease [Aerococcus mictus]